MVYMITTREDSYIPSTCLRENANLDIVIFWENSIEAREINAIGPEDIVIIAINDSDTVKLIKTVLDDHGVPAGCVIDFYKFFYAMIPFMRADRVMNDPGFPGYEGVILGLSHAEFGILADNLSVPMANLSVSSQDLYYNLQTFKYVMNKYSDRFSALNYLILDMYNYNYFNYDLSLSKIVAPYWYYGGGYNIDDHNYPDNKNFEYTLENIRDAIDKKLLSGITDDHIYLWTEFFDMECNHESRHEYYVNYPGIHKRSQMINEDIIRDFNYTPSNVVKRFESTIEENVRIFDEMLSYAREVNPDVKIYVLLMPVNAEAWEFGGKKEYLKWKPEFESIISRAKEKNDFFYLDMMDSELSHDTKSWYDTEHLNYYGAIQFTELLNSLLNK
ncbi:hypothetical protein SAMN02910292_00723 [Lachnospiraceae bacterium XBB2008]|nr:hypothetical protein SAMN02910292_00723 [Lachnospiraceae bacterium XBB2008]